MGSIQRDRRRQQLQGLVDERRGVLLARLREAMRDGRVGTSATRDPDLDSGDASQSELQTDIFFSMLQLAAGSVADGEDALRRLEEGRYGLCDTCGEEISDGRLRAMPFARCCTTCEDERDRRRQARGWETRIEPPRPARD